MGKRSYKQLNWTSRIKLETMLKHGHSKKEIAEELGVHISTVYRELKRGTYEHLNSDYTTEERYSPEIAEARYQEGLSAQDWEKPRRRAVHRGQNRERGLLPGGGVRSTQTGKI